jgi:uncharacterized RDD family membrane protein YckC
VTSQPGWHPDPLPAQPGQPAQLRYWDGGRWTEHTAPAQAPDQAATPAAYQGQYAGSQYAGNQYAGNQYAGNQYAGGQYTAYPYVGAGDGGGRFTTPDGVPLASWWQRAGALVIDWLIVSVLIAVVATPWVRDIVHAYRVYFDDALDDSRNGAGTPSTSQLQSDISHPILMIGVVSIAVTFCYHVGFLAWKQATPGKLALGLRVRLRERPGRMPFGTVLLRWLGQFGVRVIGLLPLVGAITLIYLLLDYLWPLWDDKRQSIHDQVAKTNVVRIR